MAHATRLVGAVAAALMVITAVPGTAVAAKPKASGSYGDCEQVEEGLSCVMRFTTNGKRNRVQNFSLYTECATVPIVDFVEKKFRVNAKGKFRVDGTFVDVLDREVRFDVVGRFRKKGKVATGTYDVDGAGDYDCNDGQHEFRAKYLGKA